jgi:hypothetical protein
MDAGQCGAVISYPGVLATDNCPGVSLVCSPASGTFFPKGVTPVICTAIDTSGNASTCTFNVTVSDTEPPVIACPANIVTTTAPGACDAVVSFVNPVATDNCGPVSVVCHPPAGTAFPKGVTSVTCTATDAAGNAATCTFTVTVNDTEPPMIVCPANVVVNNDAGQCEAVVNYPVPVVSDICDASPVVVCNPPSGSFFPIGTTTVTCTATDASGNGNSCTFEVTVENQTQVALLIRLEGGNVVIAWPMPCEGTYVLEQTSDLKVAYPWSPVLEPVDVVDGRFQVTTPASGAARYFRSRKLLQ